MEFVGGITNREKFGRVSPNERGLRRAAEGIAEAVDCVAERGCDSVQKVLTTYMTWAKRLKRVFGIDKVN